MDVVITNEDIWLCVIIGECSLLPLQSDIGQWGQGGGEQASFKMLFSLRHLLLGFSENKKENIFLIVWQHI